MALFKDSLYILRILQQIKKKEKEKENPAFFCQFWIWHLRRVQCVLAWNKCVGTLVVLMEEQKWQYGELSVLEGYVTSGLEVYGKTQLGRRMGEGRKLHWNAAIVNLTFVTASTTVE